LRVAIARRPWSGVREESFVAALPRRKKKRNLNSMIRETILLNRYRADHYPHVFDFDWSETRHNRASIVNLLMCSRPDGRYLEIGCADNQLFDAVLARRKTGVDPANGGTHRQTSDAFFEENPDARFDVVFIDGLHLYDQVRRDVVNALKALNPGGWIAIHDMLPRDWIEEHVPPISTGGWTGDGWKVAFELAATPDIDFRLITIDHGIAVLRPPSQGAELADLRADLAGRRFAYLHQHFDQLPAADYDAARDWIDGYLG
jgi:SAM-dependent methyltransferase